MKKYNISRDFIQRILIDGPNYSGKSTICNFIKSQLPGITVVETHDYFHRHILRSQKNIELISSNDWRNLSSKEKNISINYLLSRDESIFNLVSNAYYDDFIIERLPLTLPVYYELLFGDSIFYVYNNFIKKHSHLNFKLIYISSPIETLIERSKHDNLKRHIRLSSDAPFHLLDEDSIINKFYLYEKYFLDVDIKYKLKITTNSVFSSSIKNKIVSFLNLNISND